MSLASFRRPPPFPVGDGAKAPAFDLGVPAAEGISGQVKAPLRKRRFGGWATREEKLEEIEGVEYLDLAVIV